MEKHLLDKILKLKERDKKVLRSALRIFKGSKIVEVTLAEKDVVQMDMFGGKSVSKRMHNAEKEKRVRESEDV
jgi:polynucleotide 5'-kinase involved in rRNA processing